MLKHASRPVGEVLGSMAFWMQVGSLFNLARMDGRTYRTQDRNRFGKLEWVDAPWLTYEEYDHLFDEAVKHGIVAVFEDGKGNARAEFSNKSAMGFLRLWRGVQLAKERGLTAEQFARRYDAAIHADLEKSREKSDEDARNSAQRREQASDDLRARRNGDRRGRVVDGKLEYAGDL